MDGERSLGLRWVDVEGWLVSFRGTRFVLLSVWLACDNLCVRVRVVVCIVCLVGCRPHVNTSHYIHSLSGILSRMVYT